MRPSVLPFPGGDKGKGTETTEKQGKVQGIRTRLRKLGGGLAPSCSTEGRLSSKGRAGLIAE